MPIPNLTEVPMYVVYRDIPAGEPFDPTAPLVFFPPKGSDELFDALRIAFPLVKSHSERMREAVIAFLLEERQDDQSQPSPAMTMDTMPTTWPSMSSESASLLSTPETLNCATPASVANSPQPFAPQLTRQASTATSSQPSPPSLSAMTGVFSLSTSAHSRQRVRRKMTEGEKIEYRKRRIVKACDKCAKRKRKCPHNQAKMATVPSSKSGSKVSKSTSPPTLQAQASSDHSFASVEDFNFDPATFGPWEDFNMFEDPIADLNMDEFIDFDQQQYGSDLFTPDVSPLQSDWTFQGRHDGSALFPSRPSTGGSDPAGTVQRPILEDRLHSGSCGANGGCRTGGDESPSSSRRRTSAVSLEQASPAINASSHSGGDQPDGAINRRSKPLPGITDSAAYREESLHEAATRSSARLEQRRSERETSSQIDGRDVIAADPRAPFKETQPQPQQSQGLLPLSTSASVKPNDNLHPDPQNASHAAETSWSSPATIFCIAVLVSALLSAGKDSSLLSPTLLVLALLCPLQKEAPVQCTGKNSSWLKALGFAERSDAWKAIEGEGMDGGTGQGKRVWVEGVMGCFEMVAL